MKIKCGLNPNTFELLDDEGKKLNLSVKKATITIECGEITEAALVCYAKEIDIELEGKKITLEEYIERTIPPMETVLVKGANGVNYRLRYRMHTQVGSYLVTEWKLYYQNNNRRATGMEVCISREGIGKEISYNKMIEIFAKFGLQIMEEKLHAST